MSIDELIPIELFGINIDILTDTLDIFNRTLNISIEDDIRLGGGTALATLWKHRQSTDIDLAMPGEGLQDALQGGYRRLRDDLELRKINGQLREIKIRRSGAIGWKFRDAEVTLSAAWGRRSMPTYRESVSGIPLSPTKDILYGKLCGRAIGGGRLLARDSYDLCIAHVKQPSVLKHLLLDVLLGEDSDEMLALINRVKTTPHRIIEGRPILQPSMPEFAYDPWGSFVSIVEKVIEQDNHEHDRGLDL